MCHFVSLSGGQIGFHCMGRTEANEAAKELGAVNYSQYIVSYPRMYAPQATALISVTFFDKNNEEVFYWSYQMNAGQVFNPPRKWGRLPHDLAPL